MYVCVRVCVCGGGGGVGCCRTFMNVSTKFVVEKSSNQTGTQPVGKVEYQELSIVLKTYQSDLQTAIGGKVKKVEPFNSGE